MIRFFYIFFVAFTIISCSKNNICEELEKGTFKIIEDGKEIGRIYRKDSIQIEKYSNNDNYVKVIFLKEKECKYIMRSFEINKDIDTITWDLSYFEIKDKEYHFKVRPKHINTNYQYEGKVIKISNSINDIVALELLR